MVHRGSIGVCLFVAVAWAAAVSAQGVYFPGAGAANRSMGGASTAAPLDAAGATYWNPAAMAGMEDGAIFVGVDFLYANTFLDSSVEVTGAFGSNRSDSGLAASPAFGVVTRPENSSFTYGVGIYSLVGRTIDFPGSDFNPVLRPWDPPNSFGFGPLSSRLSGLRIDPMMSKEISDNLAVGIGAQVTSLSLSYDPAFFTGRNANGLFPAATQSRPYWGGGFQVGIFFTPNDLWNFGASYKSPQWFELFEYNSKDEIGRARTLSLELQFPSVISLGTAYKGFEDTVVAFDLRYFGYGNAKLFGEEPGQGGLGWSNVWAMAIGAEYTASEMVKLQGGFSMNGNPIPNAATLINIQLPAINKFAISGGLTVALTEDVDIVGSTVYGLRHTNSGSILEIPGTSIELRQDLWTFSLGFSFKL